MELVHLVRIKNPKKVTSVHGSTHSQWYTAAQVTLVDSRVEK